MTTEGKRKGYTMEKYQKLVRELINDHVQDVMSWDKDKTRKEVLEALRDDHENVFGNIDGSRTYSTYKAQKFIDESGAIWDTDIHDLFESIGDDYFFDCLKRGAETLDVVTCELLADQIIDEMLQEGE